MPTTGMKVRLIPWEETMGLTKQLLVGLAALGACSAYSVVASAQNANDGKVVIGALVDMTGVYSRHGGPGVVEAVKMAVADFGGTVNGKPITVLYADYQNKVDITAATARKWMDTDGADMIKIGRAHV